MSKIKKTPLRILLLMSFLTVISIVCGKYMAINIGDFIRLSFENMPILFAGILLGPVYGMTVGVVADLLGCLLVGYAINPIITTGAAFIGLLSGILWRYTEIIHRTFPRLLLTVFVSHMVGSVVIKTGGLYIMYGTEYTVLLFWRLLNYLIVTAYETFVLLFLLKNKTVIAAAKRFMERAGIKKDTEKGEEKEAP